MSRCSPLVLAALALLAPSPRAGAGVTFFTDRAEFEAAVSGRAVLDSITFDGVAEGGYANGATFGSNVTSFSTFTGAEVLILTGSNSTADPYIRSQITPRPLQLDFSSTTVFAVGMDVTNLNLANDMGM